MFASWIATGVTAAVASASAATYQKRLLTDARTSPLEISYITNLVATIALLPVVVGLTTAGVPSASISLPLVVSALSNVVGLLLFLSALDYGDLSVIGPLKGLIPVAVAVLEPFVFTTAITPELATACLVTVVGTAILLGDDVGVRTVAAKFTNRGPLLGFASALLYAGAVLADSYAVAHSNPFTYTLTLSIAITLALIVTLAYKSESPTRTLTTIPRDHLPLGVFRAGAVFFGILTLSLTSATKATILLQLALLINVLIGVAMFKEGHLYKRAAGTLLILASIVLVT